MCNSLLGPMAQDIPEQDIVMGELELPPQMDPEPKMAAVYDTSPPLPHQDPPPIPAETARPGAPVMAQLFAILAGMEANLKANTNGINEMNGRMQRMNDNLDNKMDGMAQTVRGETQNMGRCLQAGKMATPRAATNELEGSAPAGEDREIRETCRARIATVTSWRGVHRRVKTGR